MEVNTRTAANDLQDIYDLLYSETEFGSIFPDPYPEWVIQAMTGFAKYHVKLALEAAYNNTETIEYDNDMGEFTCVIDQISILNSYPLENIK